MKYTLQDAIERYIGHIKLSKKPSTALGHKNLLLKYLLGYFDDIKLAKIKSKDIQRFQQYLLNYKYGKNHNQPLKNIYLSKIQIVIRSFFDWCSKFEYINKNPFDVVALIQHRTYQTKKNYTILTYNQYNDFISHVDDVVYKVLFNVLYWCGLRSGELIALNINDYDSIKKIIHVYKSYDTKNRIITTTKTNTERYVTVPNHQCAKTLNALLETYKQSERSSYNVNRFYLVMIESFLKRA